MAKCPICAIHLRGVEFGPSRAGACSTCVKQYQAKAGRLEAEVAGAGSLVGAIERMYPNWKSFRDLVDCIAVSNKKVVDIHGEALRLLDEYARKNKELEAEIERLRGVLEKRAQGARALHTKKRG